MKTATMRVGKLKEYSVELAVPVGEQGHEFYVELFRARNAREARRKALAWATGEAGLVEVVRVRRHKE